MHEIPEGLIKSARLFKSFMNGGDERLDNSLIDSQVRAADQDVYEADTYEQEWAELEREEKQEVIERLERWRSLKGYRAARRGYALLCVTICLLGKFKSRIITHLPLAVVHGRHFHDDSQISARRNGNGVGGDFHA